MAGHASNRGRPQHRTAVLRPSVPSPAPRVCASAMSSILTHGRRHPMSWRRVGAGAAVLVAGAFFTSAQAAPVTGGVGTTTLIDPSALVQKTQVIVFGGRRWCYYWDAWNGPGWYWCGYGWRRGFGWGGGPGWHGWRYHSRDWHRRHRDWDRGGDRRRANRGDRRGRDADRGSRSDRRSVDRGRSGGRDGMSRSRGGGGDRGFTGRGGGGGDRGMSRGGGGRESGGGGRGGGGGGGGRGGGDGGGRGGRG